MLETGTEQLTLATLGNSYLHNKCLTVGACDDQAPGDSFPRLVQLLKFPEYRTFLLSGIVISIGGLADSLGKVSSTALVDFLKGTCDHETNPNPAQPHYLGWLGGELSRILADHAGNDRVIVPALKVTWSHFLFSFSVADMKL